MAVPQNVVDIIRAGGARVAVIGASNNPDKYGNMIVRTLAGRKFTVLPVNPSDSEICGIPAFADLDSVPDPVDIVSFVTPPRVTATILAGMDAARFPVVWFQDGSCDQACLDAAMARFGTVVHGDCIMVAARTLTDAPPPAG